VVPVLSFSAAIAVFGRVTRVAAERRRTYCCVREGLRVPDRLPGPQRQLFSNQVLKVVDGKLVLTGPVPEATVKTELFTGIETMMGNAFRLVSDIFTQAVGFQVNHNDRVLKSIETVAGDWTF
jgi:hypothetical protein